MLVMEWALDYELTTVCHCVCSCGPCLTAGLGCCIWAHGAALTRFGLGFTERSNDSFAPFTFNPTATIWGVFVLQFGVVLVKEIAQRGRG